MVDEAADDVTLPDSRLMPESIDLLSDAVVEPSFTKKLYDALFGAFWARVRVLQLPHGPGRARLASIPNLNKIYPIPSIIIIPNNYFWSNTVASVIKSLGNISVKFQVRLELFWVSSDSTLTFDSVVFNFPLFIKVLSSPSVGFSVRIILFTSTVLTNSVLYFHSSS